MLQQVDALYVVFIGTDDAGERVAMTQTLQGTQALIIPARFATEEETLATLQDRLRVDPAYLGKQLTIARFTQRETVANLDRRDEPRPGRAVKDPFTL